MLDNVYSGIVRQLAANKLVQGAECPAGLVYLSHSCCHQTILLAWKLATLNMPLVRRIA